MKRLIAYIPLILLMALPLFPQQKAAPAIVQLAPRVDPPSPDASANQLEQQGDDLRGQKDFLDAVDYYNAAIQKADSPPLHNKVGICFLMLQRDKDARKEFKQAIKRDPKYAEAYNNMGVAYYNRRNYGAAEKQYRKAIQLNDQSASFHSNLGTAYFSRHDYSRASREYIRALELDPTIFERQASGGVSIKLVDSRDMAHFHYVLAQMYAARGDVERCRLFLAKSSEEGYPFVRDALKDAQFGSLRKDPNFVGFVKSLKLPPADGGG